jgi:hypothetical protein
VRKRRQMLWFSQCTAKHAAASEHAWLLPFLREVTSDCSQRTCEPPFPASLQLSAWILPEWSELLLRIPGVLISYLCPGPLSPDHQVTAFIKRKAVPVLNQLSTTPWRRMAEWRYRLTFYWPRQQLEVSGQLHAPAPGTHWMGGWVSPRSWFGQPW